MLKLDLPDGVISRTATMFCASAAAAMKNSAKMNLIY
jgi:hypothetical protein